MMRHVDAYSKKTLVCAYQTNNHTDTNTTLLSQTERSYQSLLPIRQTLSPITF